MLEQILLCVDMCPNTFQFCILCVHIRFLYVLYNYISLNSQWRFVEISMTFLVLSIHHEEPLPCRAVRAIVNGLVHDALAIRKVVFNAFVNNYTCLTVLYLFRYVSKEWYVFYGSRREKPKESPLILNNKEVIVFFNGTR